VLDELGWDAEWADLVAGRPGEPARVVRAESGHAVLATATGKAQVRFPWPGYRRLAPAHPAAAVADGTLSPRRVAAHAALRQDVGWLRDRYDDARGPAAPGVEAAGEGDQGRPSGESPARRDAGTAGPTTVNAATVPCEYVTVPSAVTRSRTVSSPGWLGS
jgi:hypothetical protein